jgi:hypothetical protein
MKNLKPLIKPYHNYSTENYAEKMGGKDFNQYGITPEMWQPDHE